MARYGLVYAGIMLLVIALLAYYSPFSFTVAGESMRATIPDVVAFCESGVGQFAQLSPEVVRLCTEFNNFMYGIYGAGLLGIILMVAGAVAKGGPRLDAEGHPEIEENSSLEILKERYAKGEINKEEFDKMKIDLENS